MNAGTNLARATALVGGLARLAALNSEYQIDIDDLRAGEAPDSFQFRLLSAQLDRLQEVEIRLDGIEEILRDIQDRVEVINRAYRGEFA